MKLLVIQNRKGIGDMVIFLPFIEAIAKKYNNSVSILVKENSKASHFLYNNKYINNIIILDRDKKEGLHAGLLGSVRLINDIKKFKFEKVFIFNSSLRYYLISKIAGIHEIYQYPLFKKKNQHIVKAAQNFLLKKLIIDLESNPKKELEETNIKNSKIKYNIDDNQLNIILGIGGSGPTKRIPAKIFLQFMEMVSNKYECKFFLATGKKQEEQLILNEILKSEFKKNCIPLDHLRLKDTLPIIKNCKIPTTTYNNI